MPSKSDSIETISALPSMRKKSTAKTRSRTSLFYVGKRRVDLDYAIGDNVLIDEGKPLGGMEGMVTKVSISSSGASYLVEWMNDGSNCTGWFDPMRLVEAT